MAGRRCARPGCRAWAARGTPLCWAHRGDDVALDRLTHNDLVPDEREDRAAAFAALVTHGVGGDLVAGAVCEVLAGLPPPGNGTPLAGEIQALRLILARMLALDALAGEPREVAQTATRLVDTIVRAVRAQHGLTGDDADGVRALVTATLTEMGLGEPG